MFIPGKPIQPSIIFANKANIMGTLICVKHLSVAQLLGLLLAFPAKIILGGTNTPAYCEQS